MFIVFKINLTDNIFILTIFAIFILLIVKLFATANYYVIFSTLLYESAIFILIFLIYTKLFGFNKYLSFIFFNIAYFVHFILSLISSYFLEEAITRKYSLFSIDYSMISFFFQNMIPLNLLILLVLIFIIFVLFLKYAKFKPLLISEKIVYVILILAIIIAITFPFLFAGNFSNVYVNTIAEVFVVDTNKLDVDLTKIDIHYNSVDFNKAYFPDVNTVDFKYKKVIIFTMEETSLDYLLFSLDQDQNTNNMFLTFKQNMHLYTNYYTNNQDSRVALMNMLKSVFVPYESYSSENWMNLYAKKVFSGYGLVDYFRDNNYETHYFISAVSEPFEIDYYNWDKIHNVPESVFDTSKEYLCLQIMQYQKGCEDRAIYFDLINTFDNNENQFVFLEFLYGHGTKYVAEKKILRPNYYIEFVYDFYNDLRQKGLLKDTLIVLTSDHGGKGISSGNHVLGYKVPLILLAEDFNYYEDNNLYSHIDFKDLLFKDLIVDYNLIKKNEFIFFMGTTKSDLIGYADNQNNGVIYNLKKEPRILSTMGNPNITNLKYMYALYRYYLKRW